MSSKEKMETVLVRLPKDIKDRLKEVSDKYKMPMSVIIREWIIECLPEKEDMDELIDMGNG
jgi:predicted DNA-binding protein